MFSKLSNLCISKSWFLDWVMNLSQEVFWACDFSVYSVTLPDVYACQRFMALSLRLLWATGWCVSGRAGCGGGCWVARALLGTSRNIDFGHGNGSSCNATRHYHINVSLLLLLWLGCWERSQPKAPTADFPARPSVRYSPQQPSTPC